MINKEFETIEKAFWEINKAIKNGKFSQRQVEFIRDMSSALSRDSQVLLDKILKYRTEQEGK